MNSNPEPTVSSCALSRREAMAGVAAAFISLPGTASAAAEQKVLRYAFEIAETSFDPAKVNDLYSRTITPHIFEALYRWDHLARPVKLLPLTADGMPSASDDFRTWTVKVRPGIYFADDPAFKGQRRELVAQDFVYAFKRLADPANRSPGWPTLQDEGLLGLAALRQRALDDKKPFDYDTPIEGIYAVDRHTLRVRLAETRPRFIEQFAASDILGAVAREVVEHYKEDIDAHPVGTGPFMLKEWRRSSFIVLERNPTYRERFYDAEPAADDAEGQALLARFKGRRLPMVDRVEISIINEEQPRWLSFVNGEADVAYRVGFQFVTLAMPNGKVAPNLAKQGIVGHRIVEPAANFLFFNMEDPMVGGYAADRVALRRAIGLGMDVRKEIAYAYMGLATVSHSPYMPFTTGYDGSMRSEMGEYNPPRAAALLDLYGYTDRNGDGWREMPDGSPLELRVAAQSDQRTRKINEVFRTDMNQLGIRTRFEIAQWPENLKQARNGKLQIWTLGLFGAGPDGQGSMSRYRSGQVGGQNFSRFKMPRMDQLLDKAQTLPDGPERLSLLHEAERLAIAYMPYKIKLNRMSIDMTWPHVIGYRRPVFWQEWWHYVDIDRSSSRQE